MIDPGTWPQAYDENPYADHVDALNERTVAERLREPSAFAAVSAVWPKVDDVWERVPRIDALQLGRWLARLGTLLAVIAIVNVATVWLITEQERERAEQHDAIEQRLRKMERQNAVMLDRLIDVRERDTVRYDEQLDAWVVIERAR
jgi:hypothetical protein